MYVQQMLAYCLLLALSVFLHVQSPDQSFVICIQQQYKAEVLAPRSVEVSGAGSDMDLSALPILGESKLPEVYGCLGNHVQICRRGPPLADVPHLARSASQGCRIVLSQPLCNLGLQGCTCSCAEWFQCPCWEICGEAFG